MGSNQGITPDIVAQLNGYAFERQTMEAVKDWERNLPILFEQLKTGIGCLRELRSVYNETMAFDFNSLDFFEPNENKTSEILAFLLNPRESHGQGDRFLKQFCEYLNVFSNNAVRDDWFNTTICVNTEHSTGNGRIDITVTFGGRAFAIGIENKIHDNTKDQRNQLRDYDNFLCVLTKGNYVLYYLTPQGHTPSEESIPRVQMQKLMDDKKLALISYENHIIEILERFMMVCKADKVQYFLKEFQAYLKQSYTGVKYMDEAKYIREIITKEENHECALLISRDIDAVKKELLLKVKRELEDYVRNQQSKDFELSQFLDYDLIQAKCAQLLRVEIQKDFVYFLQFESPNAHDFFEGLESTIKDNDLLAKLKNVLGWEDHNKEYYAISEWWAEYDVNWNHNITPWLHMAQNVHQAGHHRSRFSNNIIERIEKVKEAIKSVAN